MRMISGRLLCPLLLGFGLLLGSGTLLAQSFPSKPVRIIVPAPPGGAIDIIARLLGERLTPMWGQSVLVENKPGGSQIIGTDVVAKSAPDGYNLVIVVSSHAVNPVLFKTLPYDSMKDFSFVMQTHVVPLLLAVAPSLPIKTIPELLAYAKANPGKLSYASGGQGSSLHTAAELFKSMTGTDILHIPYKGSSAAHPDVLSGRTSMIFDTITAIMPHVRSGAVRSVAVTTLKRSSIAPEVPTIAESGVPGFDTSSWGGILAAPGTPRDVIETLNAGMNKVLLTPDVGAKLSASGIEVVGGSARQWEDFMQAEIRKWAKVARDAGIKPE
jgi:tripartite-type tricarboxylate transporter receptor subunit TctC